MYLSVSPKRAAVYQREKKNDDSPREQALITTLCLQAFRAALAQTVPQSVRLIHHSTYLIAWREFKGWSKTSWVAQVELLRRLLLLAIVNFPHTV